MLWLLFLYEIIVAYISNTYFITCPAFSGSGEGGSTQWIRVQVSLDIRFTKVGAILPEAAASPFPFFLPWSHSVSLFTWCICVDCELPHSMAAPGSKTRIPTSKVKVIFYELVWEVTQQPFWHVLLVIQVATGEVNNTQGDTLSCFSCW